MESGQDSSHLNQNSQQPQSLGQPQSPEVADSPEVLDFQEEDSSLSQESIQADSPEEELTEHRESDGYSDEVQAVSDEEIAEIDALDENIPDAPDSSWDSLDIENISSLDVGWLPEEHQPKVQSLLTSLNEKVSEYRTGLDSAKLRFDSAESDFRDLISRLDGASSDESIQILSTQVEDQNKQLAETTNDLIGTTWKAFNSMHPEFEKIPDNLRHEFASILESKSFYDKFQGDTLLDKMEDAWRFAAYRTGVDLSRLPSSAPISAHKSVLINENVSTKSKRQGVIADGSLSTNRPTRSIDDMSWEDIRDRHGYLLEGFSGR